MTGSNHPVPEQLLSPVDITTLTVVAHDLARVGSLLEPGRHLGPAEAAALAELTTRLSDTYPFHDPRYAGQMLKPPHPLAWAAYAITMLLNPNNHAYDGGPSTAHLEREAVAQLASMFGLGEHLGHLTSSGTMANLEALWVARQLAPGKACASSTAAHYTHARMAAVLGMDHLEIPVDEFGRMDVVALEKHLVQGGIGVVIATLGTTSIGALDPVAAIAPLCREYGVRLHVDAAYGGFFRLLADEPHALVARAPFAALPAVDSIVIDPHKHGLQPYGCGCVLFADPSVGRLYKHDSPYTYFTSDELHPGEVTLECSRAGAAAAALWATLRAMPPTRDGLGEVLAPCRRAAQRFAEMAGAHGLSLVVEPELDIVCYFSSRARTTREITHSSEMAFEACASDGWHLAKTRVDAAWLQRRHPNIAIDADIPATTVLRSVFMKPEHEAAVPDLLRRLAHVLHPR